MNYEIEHLTSKITFRSISNVQKNYIIEYEHNKTKNNFPYCAIVLRECLVDGANNGRNVVVD